jgi:diphosphomevalonate decarboxylase
LLRERIDTIVPMRMAAMSKAIKTRDFDLFAEITMKDSNQFHAVCLDTFPPIFYMNETSRSVIRFVTAYNELFLSAAEHADGPRRGYRVAYTFDAGPNAVLYLPSAHVPEVLRLIQHFFPTVDNTDLNEYYGEDVSKYGSIDESKSIVDRLAPCMPVTAAGSLKRVIHTRVGDGPRLLAQGNDTMISLLDKKGLPKSVLV